MTEIYAHTEFEFEFDAQSGVLAGLDTVIMATNDVNATIDAFVKEMADNACQRYEWMLDHTKPKPDSTMDTIDYYSDKLGCIEKVVHGRLRVIMQLTGIQTKDHAVDVIDAFIDAMEKAQGTITRYLVGPRLVGPK